METFSLREMLICVAMLAIACATLVAQPSDLFSSSVLAIVTVLMLGAVVGAICATGERRAYYSGTAVFGWGYLLFAHNLLFEHDGVFGLEHEGLMAGALSWLSVRIQGIRFHQPIWHAYAALLFAMMGGALGRYLHLKNQTDKGTNRT